jgi:amino acid transporter
VPRATFLAVLTIGFFYTLTTWLMVEGQGAAGLQEHIAGLTPDPTAFLFELSATYIGGTLTTVMSLLFISSVFAALLAFHNAVARYLYALGREGLVPAALGRTHKIHLSPHVGSLSQTVLAVIIVLLFVITAQDPVLALFTWLTQLGTLAIIVPDGHRLVRGGGVLRRQPRTRQQPAADHVAPIVGGLAMTAVAIYAASQFGLLIGNPESPLRWLLPGLIVVAAAAGVGTALALRSRSPELYAQMGRHRDMSLTPD